MSKKIQYIFIFLFSLVLLSIFFLSFGAEKVFHADFKMQDSLVSFFGKHFFVWSDVASALNIDGATRFFTRLPIVLFLVPFFYLESLNVVLSYLYLLYSFGFLFFSFNYFSKHFLKISSSYHRWFFSILFALNPIFLGNTSKIGLVFSGASLLLTLVFAKKAFDERKLFYIYLIALTFLFSLIHPFNSAINLFILLAYISYRIFTDFKFFKDNFSGILLHIFVSVLMFASIFFLLFSGGSVSKEAITGTIGADSGNLLLGSVAKTSGFLEAFTFSKSVFLDYEFYSEKTRFLYIIGTYGLFSVTIFLLWYFFHVRILKNKLVVVVSMASLLILLLLGNGTTYVFSEAIYNGLVESSFGWFFRSPLKWQLYMPIFFTIILICGFESYFRNVPRKISRFLLVLMFVFFVLSIFYLIANIYDNLIDKKKIDLYDSNIQFVEGDKALVVYDQSCKDLVSTNPELYDELVFYFFSEDVNLTTLSDSSLLSAVWIYNNFNYIVTCNSQRLDKNASFVKTTEFDNQIFIYDNLSVNEYIDSFEFLYDFNYDDLSNSVRDFVIDNLNSEFNVKTYEEDIEGVQSSRIISLFNPHVREIYGESRLSGNPDLYVNKVKSKLQLKISEDRLFVQRTLGDSIFVNNSLVSTVADKSDILYADIFSEGNFLLENGTAISPIQDSIAINSSLPARIYSKTTSNKLTDGSFEERLWQPKVGDCNNFDDNPILAMERATFGSLGDFSLELGAQRHIACTKQSNIFVEPGEEYVFEFDYQSNNAQEAGFYISFDGFGGEDAAISEKITILDDQWTTYRKKVIVPATSRAMTVYLYGYAPDEGVMTRTRYDNVGVYQLEKVKEILPEEKSDFVKVDLPPAVDGQYMFEYRDPDHDFSNQIVNGSLEEGLWQSEVGNCNNFDDNPIISMEQSSVASDGVASLMLSSTRHTACTSPATMAVRGGVDYLLEFDVRAGSETATEGGYYISFNDVEKTSFSGKIELRDDSINPDVIVVGNEWKSFSEKIEVPADATSAKLLVYSYPDGSGQAVETLYDNFSFVEMPDMDNRYYVVSESEVETAEPESVGFEIINPTKKLVTARGVTKPFYLTMSESYHDKWQLHLDNSLVRGLLDSWVPFVRPNKVSDDRHYSYMTFLNGWYVDPQVLCHGGGDGKVLHEGCTINEDSSYDIDMVIEFFPQRWFYLGLLISGITFFGVVGYLIVLFYMRKTRKR